MPLDDRWAEVFLMYGPMTSHMFKVWTLSTADARAFQRKWNAHVDATQPKRYTDDVQEGDYYGVALAVCDLGRKTSNMQQLMVVLLREAVELLHMIACVDLELWREVFIEVFSLKDRWKRHVVPVWSFLPYDPLARSVDAANSDVSKFFAGLQRSARSPFYGAAKKLTFEILGIANDPRKQRLLPTEMDMILLLTPEISEFVPRDKVGLHLRATEESLREMVRCTPHESILPIYARSTLVTADEDVVDSECLSDLVALSAATSIDYLEIHLKPAEKDNGVHLWSTFGKLLRHIALRRKVGGKARHLGVQLAGGDLRRFVAVCSAVHDSRAIGSFKIRAASVHWPSHVWLRWLAWSWLSNGPNSEELAAELNVKEFTDTDVETLGAVLSGGNPCSPSGPPVRWVTTATSALVTFPDDDSKATTMVDECTHLAIVGESPNARELSVLVPGFGIAHIDRDAVVPLAADPVRSRVTSLGLSANGKATGASGVLALVAMLGSGLTSLHLVLYEFELEQQHIVTILESCPRLNSLNVSGSAMRDLDFLVDFCNRPTSTLTELILNDVRLTTWTGADAFFAALSTPSSRVARKMKEVAVGFTEDASVDASVVEAVFTMLEQNGRLKNFQVRFPDRLRPSESKYPESDEGPIAQPAYMVSLRQKLAFMSGLNAGASSRGASSAAGRLALDQLALANVFELAAEQSRRSAMVNFGRSYYV